MPGPCRTSSPACPARPFWPALLCALILAMPAFGADVVEPHPLANVLTDPEPLKIGGVVIAPPEKQGELFEKVLQLNLVQEPELDLAAARKAFAALVEKAKTALAPAKTPKEKIAALNTVLLAERKVSYLSNLYWRDATLAASLLRGQGNCLSTATLYAVVGDALDLPIKVVFVPRHAFVRWDDDETRINIETTAGGTELPDRHYLYDSGRATPADVEALHLGQSASMAELYAHLVEIAGMHRAGENRLDEALKFYEETLKELPFRSDLKLRIIWLRADVTKDRAAARDAVLDLLRERDVPPSVSADALVYLAKDYAGTGDHERERKLLLVAFAHAPKSMELGILTDLAFCHRALKDPHGAVRYMELAAAMIDPGDPSGAATLYNLAILQKCDGRIPDALDSIHKALKLNPESWNLKVLEAGYLVLTGQREEGLRLFELVQEPRGDKIFYEVMRAWFYAASQQRGLFYPQFTKALEASQDTHILEWIDQDVDLDVYRNEPEFKALLDKHRARLLGKK